MFAIKDERLKANYKEKTTNIINIFQEALSSNTYYTDHGQKHSARVINHLGLLVDNFEEVFKLSELTDAEKYLLCMASHLHDLGMAIEKYEKNEEKRRSNHSELSARFVEENESLLGLVGDLRGIKTPLKDIIRTHRKQYDIPEYIKDPEPKIGNFGTIRLDLLAAIFRIGDTSDVDYMDINSTSGGLTILCTFKSKRGKGEYNLDLNALKRYVRSIDDTPYFTDFIKKELKL